MLARVRRSEEGGEGDEGGVARRSAPQHAAAGCCVQVHAQCMQGAALCSCCTVLHGAACCCCGRTGARAGRGRRSPAARREAGEAEEGVVRTGQVYTMLL